MAARSGMSWCLLDTPHRFVCEAYKCVVYQKSQEYATFAKDPVLCLTPFMWRRRLLNFVKCRVDCPAIPAADFLQNHAETPQVGRVTVRWNEKWGTLRGSFTQRYALIFKCSRPWRCIHNTSELFCRVNLTACAVSGIKRSKSDKNAMFASTSPNAGDNIGWLTGVNVWWSTLCTFPNHTRTAKNITWSQLLIAF